MDLGIVAGKEKVQLQDGNDGMDRLGDPQEGMRQVAGSKADFPAGVLFSEEEKLKISKDLVDLQIETNKMKEQYETENFELKNMVLALESRVRELELCSEEVTGERDSLQERLRALESTRKELAQEYIILKSNYLALGKELDQEVRRNEELTQELLKLARGKNSLPGTESTHLPAMAHQSSVELERERGKPEDVVASEHERQELERNLLGNQDHIKVELEKLKKTHDWQQQKLEERVLGLGKELQEAKGAIGDTQRRLVEQSAVLLTSQSQLQEVEAENSRLQLRLKELNEEYRSRLARYIRDVAKRLKEASAFPLPPEQQLDEEGWAEVRKQLRELAHTTQEDLEQERSQLLTRAVVAEEQVLELQEYIDQHLARYKREILRLRNAEGSEGPRALSARAAAAPPLPRARTASHDP
ncbi:coiled-coil domain containing 78 [Pitangus sulphuratus]|nr:coiled-coil domain containing 78 [Pitangus sulphuratus]